MAAADLKRLIRRTIFATDVESTRYALGGVLVELSDDSITMVGTDGRRLARMSAPAEAENGAVAPTGSPVVPVKALKLIERNLDDDDPPVHLAIQAGTAVLVRTERAIIYSRLVEGRFPRYQDVFPSSVEVKIPMEVGPLRLVVEQASIVTSEESRGVDFRFSDGLLRLSSQAADVGRSHVELPIAYEGKDVEITFDPRYLTDALRTLDEHASDHRRADRPQERRRLQDRRRLHVRGHAPDPRPLARSLGEAGPPGRIVRRASRCFVPTRRWPVAMRGAVGYNGKRVHPRGRGGTEGPAFGRGTFSMSSPERRGARPLSDILGELFATRGLRPAPRPERTRGRLERGGRRAPVPPDPGRRGPPRGPERDGGPLDAPGRAGRVPQARTPGRAPARRAGDVHPRHPVPRRPDRPPRPVGRADGPMRRPAAGPATGRDARVDGWRRREAPATGGRDNAKGTGPAGPAEVPPHSLEEPR